MAKDIKQKKDLGSLSKTSVKMFAALCFSSALSACGGHMSSNVDTQIIVPADANFADVAEADKVLLHRHHKAVHAVAAKPHHNNKAKKKIKPLDDYKASDSKWDIKRNAKGELLYSPQKPAASEFFGPVMPAEITKIEKKPPLNDLPKPKPEKKDIKASPTLEPIKPAPQDAAANYPAMPKKAAVTPPEPVKKIEKPVAPVAPAAPVVSGNFEWPVKGKVTKEYFGPDPQNVRSINIAVPVGTPVHSAESGIVIYAGNGLKEFGNIVLIKHDNNVVTVYGNNSELRVKHGQHVNKGDVIALSGDTGEDKEAGLHFEVRDNLKPVDPMSFLAAMPG